jgi:hypothetical protein
MPLQHCAGTNPACRSGQRLRDAAISQCLNGGYASFEVECHRCKTRAGIPLDAIRRPRQSVMCAAKRTSKTHRTNAAPIKDPAALDGVKFGRAARDHKTRRSMDFITIRNCSGTSTEIVHVASIRTAYRYCAVQ